MPTKRELYDYLDGIMPKTLSCEWDNDGLMCCSHPEDEVKKILFTLDITPEAIEYAVNNGYDTVISHHPIIFKGIKAVNTDIGVPKRLIRLIESRITAMSFHTRFDSVAGGVNDALAEALELTDTEPFGDIENGVGRVGTLPREMSVDELAYHIKEKLGAPYVNYNGAGEKIARLAVLGGAGDDCFGLAVSTGAQAYLTGELKYHQLTDSADMGITLYEAGHYHTEYPSLSKLEQTVKAKYPDTETEIYKNYLIKTV